LGTVAHAAWAKALEGTLLGPAEPWPLKDALLAAAMERGRILPTKDYNDAANLGAWFARYWREVVENGNAPWEKVANIETEFSFVAGECVTTRGDIVEVVVKGIFDSLLLHEGVWWHGQLKTRGGYKPFGPFAWATRRSWHELLYWEGARRMGEHWDYAPWGGTILFCVDKIPQMRRAEKKGEEPTLRALEEGFHVAKLPVQEWERDRVVQEVLQAGKLIAEQEELSEGWDPFGQPFTAPVVQSGRGHECLKWGTSKCAYEYPCDGHMSIMDPFMFKDRSGLERYEGEEEESG
jgi:hypothetical protein